jgi:CHAD domain-containing protein
MISRSRSTPLLLRIDRWRGRLDEVLGGLTSEISPEECHEIRDSLGRIATWLRLAGFLSLRERVKTLRRAVGAVRDLDVVIEQLDAAAIGNLRQARRRQSATLRSQLAGAAASALQHDLQDVPAMNCVAAVSETRRLARRVRRAGAAFAETPTGQNAHRLRRRLREYRFAREWLRLPTSHLKPLIRRLGRLNDEALVRTVLRDRGAESADWRTRGDRELEACRGKWKSLQRHIRDW